MKISYSLLALIFLMPACIGFAYYSKLHWQADARAAMVENSIATVVPETTAVPSSYSEALKVATQSNKKVLFYVGDDVAPCRQMSETFANIEVKKAMDGFVFYKADLQKDYDVICKKRVLGVPTYMIVAPDDRTIAVGTGYKNAENFVAWLNAPVPAPAPLAAAVVPTYSNELAYIPGTIWCDRCAIWHHRNHPCASIVAGALRGLWWVVSPRYRHYVWHRNHDMYPNAYLPY